MRDEFAGALLNFAREPSETQVVAQDGVESWCDGARAALSAPWQFQDLLGALPEANFCERIWCKRPVHLIRESPGFYGHLLSLLDLERYLSMRELFERHSLTTPEQGHGLPHPPPRSLSELYERLLSGRALRIRNMETFLHPSEPLVALVNSIERALGQSCDSISCYVSNAGARGLGPHHDETEIFTLQISGEKRWRIYHRDDSAEPRTHLASTLGAPRADFVLKPGDLLYVPRGWVHEVTSEVASFSLTIVFRPVDWRALPEILLERLANSPVFREPLPNVLGRERNSDAWQQQFERRVHLMRAALAELTPQDVIDSAARSVLSRTTLPAVPQLSAILSLERVTADTLLRKRPGIVAHLTVDGAHARLLLPGGYSVTTSARAEPALRQLLDGHEPFRVREMHASLGSEAKLVLARRLVAAGLLCLEQPWQPRATDHPGAEA